MTTEPIKRSAKAVQAGGQLNLFERYLSVWVFLCILVGIGLGRTFPKGAEALDDFSQAKRAAQTPKPVLLTLVINGLIKPFTMVAFAPLVTR